MASAPTSVWKIANEEDDHRPSAASEEPHPAIDAQPKPLKSQQRTMDAFFARPPGAKRKGIADGGRDEPSKRGPGQSGPSTPGGGERLSRADLSRNVALGRAHTRIARERTAEARNESLQPDLKDLLVEKGWSGALDHEFQKKYFHNLERFIHDEWRANVRVFPEPWNVFRALNACPIAGAKVVILGQDPYHDVGQAMGLSFSVPEGIKIPSSLRNIFKEVSEWMIVDFPARPSDDDGASNPAHARPLRRSPTQAQGGRRRARALARQPGALGSPGRFAFELGVDGAGAPGWLAPEARVGGLHGGGHQGRVHAPGSRRVHALGALGAGTRAHHSQQAQPLHSHVRPPQRPFRAPRLLRVQAL